MRRNYLLKCYVSKIERDQIKALAHSSGFKSISVYLRVLALNRIFPMEAKLQHIYDKLMGVNLNGKSNIEK